MLPGIGVFGTGSIVKVLVPFLREKGFKIEAIWSKTLHEAEKVAKELNIPYHTNKIDDVLLHKDVNLIFIVCSPNLHAQISVKALGIGKHVVCDKPAGLSQSEALKMVHAAMYYPTLISMISYTLRYLPAFTHMKKAIKDGYLGAPDEITLIDVRIQMSSLLHDKYDWMCDDTMGGGSLSMLGSHIIDLVNFLTGQYAVKVHGLVRTFTQKTDEICGIRDISAPDFCTFQIELMKGTVVTATINNHMSGCNFSQEVLVCGKNGYLIVRGGDLFGRKNRQINTKNTEEVLYLDVEDLQCPTPMSVIPRPYVKGLCKMISALKEAFPSNMDDAETWMDVGSAANFHDGLYVQAVLEAIRKSSQSREWVKVEIMSKQPDPNPFLSAAIRRYKLC